MWEFINEQTNIYAEQEISKAKTNNRYSDNTRLNRWKRITLDEIQIYMDLIKHYLWIAQGI